MVMVWPQLDVADLEVDCGQRQYWHGSIPFAVKSLYFVMSYYGVSGLVVGAPAG